MLTSKFPAYEIYGLTHQIRRAVVSNSPKEFRSFLGIALGSIGELETQLIASGRTEYLSQNELSPLSTRLDDFRIMLISLSKSLA